MTEIRRMVCHLIECNKGVPSSRWDLNYSLQKWQDGNEIVLSEASLQQDRTYRHVTTTRQCLSDELHVDVLEC